MDPAGRSVFIPYNDPRITAVGEQIGEVNKIVAEYDQARAEFDRAQEMEQKPAKTLDPAPFYKKVGKIKKTLDPKVFAHEVNRITTEFSKARKKKRKYTETLDPAPFYELVSRVKRTINPHAFGHMAHRIGIVQDLILYNAHKFPGSDKKKLLAREKYLCDSRMSRAGGTRPIMGSAPRTPLPSAATETPKEAPLPPPTTALLLTGFVPQSVDGTDPFEKRDPQELSDERFFRDINRPDVVRGARQCDCDSPEAESDYDDEAGPQPLEEWERDLFNDYRDDDEEVVA